jgi:hypothetical protein
MPLLHRRCKVKGFPRLTLNGVEDQHNPTPDLVADLQIAAVPGPNIALKACEGPIQHRTGIDHRCFSIIALRLHVLNEQFIPSP